MIPAESTTSNLIFLKNSLSSHKFLVDTGASVLGFPHCPAPSVGVQLKTADGSAIDMFGSCQIAYQFGSWRFELTFLITDVSMPMFGSDFLHHHHLLVDVAGSHLLDASTLEPIPTVSSVPAS